MQFLRPFGAALGRSAIVLAACTAFGSATTLVAIWSPGQLLIGADSNVITGTPNLVGSACKISQAGSTFFAFSGLVEDKNASYNAADAAQEAVRGPGTLTDHMQRFIALTRGPLAKAVAAVKVDSPEQYEYLRQNHPVLQAIFAEEESGAPVLGVAGFAVGPEGALEEFTKMIAEGDDGRGPRIIYAGKQNQIKAYLHSHRDWFLGDQAKLVRNLIQSEINASSGEVGGPIDIVAVEPNSAHWIQKKAQCPDTSVTLQSSLLPKQP